MQILAFPSFFLTTTMGAAHSLVEGFMMLDPVAPADIEKNSILKPTWTPSVQDYAIWTKWSAGHLPEANGPGSQRATLCKCLLRWPSDLQYHMGRAPGPPEQCSPATAGCRTHNQGRKVELRYTWVYIPWTHHQKWFHQAGTTLYWLIRKLYAPKQAITGASSQTMQMSPDHLLTSQGRNCWTEWTRLRNVSKPLSH